MGKDHRGQPSGTNKNEGTGIQPNLPDHNTPEDQEIREKYTAGEDGIPDNVYQPHPNRNSDKNRNSGPDSDGYNQGTNS